MAEPSLNPPEDALWDRACDKVSDWSDARKIAFMGEHVDDTDLNNWDQYEKLAQEEVYEKLQQEEEDAKLETALDRLEDQGYSVY